jgi:hypothetical protein
MINWRTLISHIQISTDLVKAIYVYCNEKYQLKNNMLNYTKISCIFVNIIINTLQYVQQRITTQNTKNTLI